MWKEVTYQLTSDAALLCHNGQTANPLNKFAKSMKVITAKRMKTEADLEELARLEFMAGLYMSAEGPVIPSEMIDAMLRDAAKKVREGKVVQAGVYCTADAQLEYDGPRMADDLWADESFRKDAIVRVQQNRVVRYRPIFNKWSATVNIMYEDEQVNLSQIDRWFAIGGKQIGIGDWRPKYGRFTAER